MNTVRLKTNLRCAACVEAIRPHLDGDSAIHHWSADVAVPDKILTATGEGLTAGHVDGLLKKAGYAVQGELPTEHTAPAAALPATAPPEEKPVSYLPLLLILFYLLAAVAVVEWTQPPFAADRAMRNFMAGFFLAFSFFKLLDVPAFAMAYSSYDIIARRWLGYGYLYPFIELALGLAYLGDVAPIWTNAATLLVMGISSIGVLQSLMARRKIRCACLGAVFNLPMSVVTLVEDGLMVAMAAAMLVMQRVH